MRLGLADLVPCPCRGGLTRILPFVITEGRWAEKQQQRKPQPIPTRVARIRIPYRTAAMVLSRYLFCKLLDWERASDVIRSFAVGVTSSNARWRGVR